MAFANPEGNVRQFGLKEGMHVADFGSGSGHYTLAAAKIVGDKGRVYALDIQRELLKKVKNLSSAQRQGNIEIIHTDLESPGGSKLAVGSVDAVIMSNILFQVENKPAFVAEAKRILRPGGRVLLIDWSGSFGGLGPQESQVVSEEIAGQLFEGHGFTLESSIQAGDNHYGLIFKRR